MGCCCGLKLALKGTGHTYLAVSVPYSDIAKRYGNSQLPLDTYRDKYVTHEEAQKNVS
jgi:hypothetical protein